MSASRIHALRHGLWVLLLGLFHVTFGQNIVNGTGANSPVPFLQQQSTWADSVFQTLTEEERIAQLIMIPVYSNKDRVHEDSISRLVREYKVGGLIYFQGGPVRQALMTNRFQKESKVPLMVSIDA